MTVDQFVAHTPSITMCASLRLLVDSDAVDDDEDGSHWAVSVFCWDDNYRVAAGSGTTTPGMLSVIENEVEWAVEIETAADASAAAVAATPTVATVEVKDGAEDVKAAADWTIAAVKKQMY